MFRLECRRSHKIALRIPLSIIVVWYWGQRWSGELGFKGVLSVGHSGGWQKQFKDLFFDRLHSERWFVVVLCVGFMCAFKIWFTDGSRVGLRIRRRILCLGLC